MIINPTAYIGDYHNGNYVKIDRLGNISFHGEATEWDDIRFPSTGLNPPGPVNEPDRNTDTGLLEFGASGTDTVAFTAQLPHSYKPESSLFPHVHWMKSSSASGNVVWQLEYKLAPIGEVIDGSWTTLTSSSSSITDNNTAGEHLITPLGEIVGTGLGLSDMIVMKLSRLGDDGSDTYASECTLLEADLHYEQDIFGSFGEYTR